MKELSEVLSQKIQGEDIRPNHNNRVTKKRKGLAAGILESSDGDINRAYEQSMDMLNSYIPRLQEYILSHGEAPAEGVENLAKQVYELRVREINELQDTLDLSPEDSVIFLEDQEALHFEETGHLEDNFLGELLAPITFVGARNGGADNFIDPAIIAAIIGIVGNKVNDSNLMRAAKGKKPGVLGMLSTGGNKHYNALVKYFNNNPEVKKKVLSGEISNENQLPNWTPPEGAGHPNNPLDPIIDNEKRKAAKQYLPYIIGGVILLIIIVYFVARTKHKSK